MKLTVVRTYYKDKYTIGNFYIENDFFSNTLEDTYRDVKIMHETCIPEGIYKVVLTFSNRFQKVIPQILGVPNFEGIRIHSGNTEKDTSGCILVGKNDVRGMVTNSRKYYTELMQKLETATEPITIEIR